MKRTIHVHLDVRGALLNWSDGDLDGLLVDEGGRRLSAREVRAALLDMLLAGTECLPFGEPCEGFDPKTGCPGHGRPEGPAAPPPAPPGDAP